MSPNTFSPLHLENGCIATEERSRYTPDAPAFAIFFTTDIERADPIAKKYLNLLLAPTEMYEALVAQEELEQYAAMNHPFIDNHCGDYEELQTKAQTLRASALAKARGETKSG